MKCLSIFNMILEIVPIRCKYLQKQDLVNQAIKYLDEILELNNDIVQIK